MPKTPQTNIFNSRKGPIYGMSRKGAYDKALLNAMEYLRVHKDYTKFILSMSPTHKKRIANPTEEPMISRLASLGVFNLYLDDTYNFSRIGKEVVKELQE